MKKLLTSAAVCGLAAFAVTPAHAVAPAPAPAGLTLTAGGYFKGYVAWTNQDDVTGASTKNFGIIRDTEVHLGGETTLDNGLTVGAHFEMEADGDFADSFDVQESYLYFSGGWGRVNFGAEDGAAYLLQVETPSADSNFDGLRQFVQPNNFANMGFNVRNLTAFGSTLSGRLNGFSSDFLGSGGLDYDQDVSGYANKITYLTPILNGFQAGISYTPNVDDGGNGNEGLLSDDLDQTYNDAWDLAARYEGQWNNVGVILGGGYSKVNLENNLTNAQSLALAPGAFRVTGDVKAFNGGADVNVGPFGFGVAYTNTNYGDVVEGVAGGGTPATSDGVSAKEKIWNFGADYTTGPFKIGASYYRNNNVYGIDNLDARRYTGGVVYTYGPGMTFRGSISHVKFDNTDTTVGTADDNASSTDIILGTQVNF